MQAYTPSTPPTYAPSPYTQPAHSSVNFTPNPSSGQLPYAQPSYVQPTSGGLANYAQYTTPSHSKQSSTGLADPNIISNSNQGLLPKSSFEIDLSELTFEKQIGSGGFGVVFKGTWRGGPVAIKQVLNKLNSSDLEGFKAEAKLMASLRPHVNVVQFLGISFGNNQTCIVTEFMDGGSLYDFLHSNAKLDGTMVANFSRGIAAGMLHLHSENIIHRDLASRNVLLGSGGVVKITDFGMSRVADSAAKSNQTKSNTGPLKWMAPESIKKREYSSYSDMWAYGVTLWEILTRQEPYPELDAVQAAIEVTNGNPPLRLQFPDYTPVILSQVAEQCFQDDPLKRGSFKEICDKFAKAPLTDWYPKLK